jgi:zinc protease
LMTPAIFDRVSLAQMEEIYRDRIADAGDFTFFIVGNIDETVVKPLVEKYIGSLTDMPRSENWKDNNIDVPEGKTTREILIPLQTEKATVVVSFNNQSAYNPKNNLLAEVLKGILRLRYTEEVREKEGGTYGVSVSATNDHFPKEEKAVEMQFDTDPLKAEHLKSIIYSEIDKIVANGPTAEDLDKTVKNLAKDREQSKLHNSYWLNTLAGFYQHNINNDATDNFEKILSTMSITDVQNFAKEFFKSADVVDVVFKPSVK